MYQSRNGPFAGLVALLVLLVLVTPTRASFDVSYCSSQNTAGDFDAQYWDWQSNGWCTDKCNGSGKYAFAVILYKNCWCTNYIPQDQEDTSKCNDNCPGFPSEKCGNKDDNLYIYIKLSGTPSGTQGGSSPTSSNPSSAPPSSSSSAVETSRAPETVVQTVTESQDVVTLTPSGKSSAPTTLHTTTSNQEPQTSVRVVTQSGVIVTETVISTPTSVALTTGGQKNSSSPGAIVGGVVGGVAGIAALVGGIFFFLWRRHQQQRQEDITQPGVQRNTSTLSKAGLLRTEKESQYPPPIATAFTKRQSRMLDNDSISPISGSDRRNSRLQVDQRLNPSAIFVLDNSSQQSIASMDDSRDYHRPLNVRNPDPE